ncbi:HNH endonuclease signature motif containing protein [Mycobacterium sp. Aquia_216]|uniref:HNH endonuclease signature motif containing protein n=1 Tax=Mycobacterium sp. Aquia_216 TaxID=2991729 RepID=UPI00227CCC71|nr:HNH endonuclease signature motif containing protein [Mycobacterium sp. Aquia_216]WAJ46305.1 HNH endonuclease signature motif containing protein [Mycobacterium sp. Aquia_216]
MFDAPSLLRQIGDAARAEAQAAAARLLAIGDLFRLRLAQHGDRAPWAADTCDAVAAEIAVTLGTSVAMGHSNLRYARAMHERLPEVAAIFRAGDIDFRLFRTIVFRTDLIVDAEALAAVDAQLAIKAPRWPSMTSWKLATEIDRIVATIDRDAVRRSREYAADRYFQVTPMDPGMALINGTVFATTGQALDRRLDELARTVCADDPRTIGQLRADALGALAAGHDRLTCGCDGADCPTASAPRQPGSVVIHVVADRDTVRGSGSAPGFLYGDGIVPAEIVRELSKTAKSQPITTSFTPEYGYTPSRVLTDFVRARDLTCRAPGCDRPATECDIDHTVPYGDGGATHPSNLKCLCRKHHLLKTFWGWRDQQLPDGTIIWTLPGGQTHVTTPGSALLFPALCASGDAPPVVRKPNTQCDNRDAKMPTRTHTRAQNRAACISTERRHNRTAREARKNRWAALIAAAPPDDEPPPF